MSRSLRVAMERPSQAGAGALGVLGGWSLGGEARPKEPGGNGFTLGERAVRGLIFSLERI
jgi:hypothetical protein